MKIFIILCASILVSCINTDVKDLTVKTTRQKGKTSNSSLTNFVVSYATKYQSSGGSGYVAIQGAADTAPSFLSTCGSAGTNCYCDFYHSGGTSANTSAGGSASSIKYSSTSNVVTCKMPAGETYADVTDVVVRNSSGSAYTAKETITTTLGSGGITLSAILGGQDTKYARTIYSYQCYLKARQKNSTSTTSGFDCTSQGANDFNMLRATYNYYLYQDALTSITDARATQYVFSNSQFCGYMDTQIDCTSIANTLTKEFGLYGVQTGGFTTEVKLYTGPQLGLPGFAPGFLTVQGYAVPATNFLDSECPAGYLKRSLYTITPSGLSTSLVDSATCNGACTSDNEMPDLPDRQVRCTDGMYDSSVNGSNTGTSYSPSDCSTVSGPCIPILKAGTAGDCDGTTCTLPSGAYANYTTGSWPKNTTATSTFCVINKKLLQ